MARANDELCRDNEQGMFVTAWFAEFEALTGRLVYVNAGHNPPLRRSAEGDVSWLRERSGLMLGAFDGISYRQHETTLAPGEEVVLYTDGVSEAMDEQGACLGEERLAELVAAAPAAPRDLVEALLEGVRAFAGAAPQADDITVLCLRREDAAPGEPRTRRIQ